MDQNWRFFPSIHVKSPFGKPCLFQVRFNRGRRPASVQCTNTRPIHNLLLVLPCCINVLVHPAPFVQHAAARRPSTTGHLGNLERWSHQYQHITLLLRPWSLFSFYRRRRFIALSIMPLSSGHVTCSGCMFQTVFSFWQRVQPFMWRPIFTSSVFWRASHILACLLTLNFPNWQVHKPLLACNSILSEISCFRNLRMRLILGNPSFAENCWKCSAPK